jgi:hypothetical protein
MLSERPEAESAPWNRGQLVGQKLPLKLRDVFGISVRLQLQRKTRELALFNLAIDSKLKLQGSESLFGPAKKPCEPRAASDSASAPSDCFQVAEDECGSTRPVSSSVLRFESTWGQPPDTPANISGSCSRPVCATVKRTSPSPCGSMS